MSRTQLACVVKYGGPAVFFFEHLQGLGAWPQISADGRFIAFTTCAGNLVANDANAVHDIFVHDQQTGVTERVSVSSTGEEADDSGQRLDHRWAAELVDLQPGHQC